MATNSDLDMILFDALDQPIQVDDSFMKSRVDAIFERSLQEKNPDIAFNAVVFLTKSGKLAGVGLAYMFYLMHQNWQKYNIDMDFFAAAFERTGYSSITIERYVRNIGALHVGDVVPEEYKEQIISLQMADQNAIATAVESGYPISDEQWKKLATAENGNRVLEIMREVKGVPPRKNTISLKLTRDGDIYAWNEGERFHIGWLDVASADEPVIQKAINRILSGAGITKE